MRRSRRRSRRGKGLYRPQVLPTLLTLGNLFCGFLAIAYTTDAMVAGAMAGGAAAAEGPSEVMLAGLSAAGWMIFLGMVFDALDGSVARLSGGTSALGGQLDSLADAVTFGVAPAVLAKAIAEGVGGMQNRQMTLYFSVFFACMAALRLARYNVQHTSEDEKATRWFEGLPTPGAAGVLASLAIILPFQAVRPDALLQGLPWLTLGLGLLMVSRFPFAHFTNRFLKGRKPIHYVVIGLTVFVLSAAFHIQLVLFSALFLYALSGPAVAAWRAMTGKKDDSAAGDERSPTGVEREHESVEP
ncbi:MAG: CDP-alcohol phosphatidyltransferase family protein [Planctomycetota bacterium]|jgi:CDP-diacylglycerol--serine O-phosphatidyltransferase